MMKTSTKFPQVITLASSSQSRQKIIKKYFKNVKICCHRIDEKKIKKQHKKILPTKLVEILSKKKAESVIKESSFQNTYKIIYWLLCVLLYIGIIYLRKSCKGN